MNIKNEQRVKILRFLIDDLPNVVRGQRSYLWQKSVRAHTGTSVFSSLSWQKLSAKQLLIESIRISLMCNRNILELKIDI